jgi:hypothetical protein
VVVHADAQHDLDALEVVIAVVRVSVSGFAFGVLHQNFVGTKGHFPPALTAVQMPVVISHGWLIRTAEFHPDGQNVNFVQLFVQYYVTDTVDSVYTQAVNNAVH